MIRSCLGSCAQFVATYIRCQASTQACLQVSQRSISRTCPAMVLDDSIRYKKQFIKRVQEEKIEPMLNHQGFTDFGVTIPTEDTPSSEVDGVRFDMLPIAHIKSSPNNTIIIITDHTGLEVVSKSSCGMEGFKNAKKSTTVAAQATGLSVGLKALRRGLKNVRVAVKGLGTGRLPSIKGLQMAGLNIVSLTDRTPLIHSGPRPRKAKRL